MLSTGKRVTCFYFQNKSPYLKNDRKYKVFQFSVKLFLDIVLKSNVLKALKIIYLIINLLVSTDVE